MDFTKFANLCSLSYNNEELYRYSIIISVDAQKRQELERMISQLHTFGKRTLNCAIAKKYSYKGHFISQDDIEYLADFYQNLINYTDKLELAA